MNKKPHVWKAVTTGPDALVVLPDGRSFNFGDAIYHPENKQYAELAARAVNSHADLLAALELRQLHDEWNASSDGAYEEGPEWDAFEAHARSLGWVGEGGGSLHLFMERLTAATLAKAAPENAQTAQKPV